MAATAWAFYNSFKHYVGNGTVDLSGDIFRIQLHLSSSNAETLTLTALSQVTNEVANANGYTTGGKTLSATTWAQGASAKEQRFDSTAVWWSANGGNISGIKYAVIGVSAGKLVCWSRLSTSPFSVTDTNRITITPSANGIFELNG